MARWLENDTGITRQSIDSMRETARRVNNDIREFLGEGESDILPSEESILWILRSEKLDPRAAHAKWREERLAQGWEYGEEYDAERKLTPNLINGGYDALPEEQRIKDFTFWAAVRAMAYWSENNPKDREG